MDKISNISNFVIFIKRLILDLINYLKINHQNLFIFKQKNMEKHPIVLFDGVCNLCNGAVQFMIERDKKNLLRFASLQSEIGQFYQEKAGVSTVTIDTILLVENGKIYQKSTAALRIARHLNGLWSLPFGFIIIPPFLRDWAYDFIARNRYKWFGKQESCWLPSADLWLFQHQKFQNRFLKS